MRIYSYIIAVLLSQVACIEPYEPIVGEYESTIVVDGNFSNSESPSTVILSFSFPYSGEEGSPIEGAKITIEEENGASSTLVEVNAGVYQTNPEIFRGEPGRRYRVLITTPQGLNLESDWQMMKAAPPIEDINFAFGERIRNDPSLPPELGAQILLSTKDSENETRFYRWEWEETFEYRLPNPQQVKAEFGDKPGDGDDRVVFLTPDEYAGNTCWRTEKSKLILIGSTEGLTADIIEDLPIHFVSKDSPRLSIRYSFLIKQYAITKEYFEFLRKIKEINQTTGSLFDPIPTEVFGNIRSSDGQPVPVLGYFSVAGKSESRVFINRDQIPLGFIGINETRCQVDTLPLDFIILYNNVVQQKLVLFNFDYSPFGIIIGYLVTKPRCTGCEANDATNIKPEFW